MPASAFFKNGALIESFASTATSGGTLTLTSSSDAYQVFTGTLAHTMKLPDATTMIVNQKFEVINASTGAITVQNNGNITIGTVAAGSSLVFRVTDISTANGSFDVTTAGSGGSGGLSSTEAGQFGALAAAGFSAQSRVLKYTPEEIAGDYSLAVASLPAGSAWSQGSSLNGYGFSISGLDSANTTILTTNNRYSDDHNAWLARAVIPNGRQGGAAVSYANAIYLFCGSNTSSSAGAQTTNQKYLDSTNIWSTVGAFPNARMAQLAFTLTKAYGMGGTDSGGSTGQSENYLYDSVLDAWALRAPMLTARAQGSAWAIDGFGYIAHGSPNNGSTLYDTSAKYSEASDTWMTLPTMLTQRYHTIGAAGNGFGYSLGGYTTQSFATVDEFSPSLNTWKLKAVLLNVRHGSNIAFQLNGVPYVPGGRQLPAATNIALTDKYVASSVFNLGSLKKANGIPASVAVAVILNALTPNVPVQVRTSGNEWKNFISGNSSLKQGETTSIKWAESSEMFVAGGGSPQVASTELHNPTTVTWVTRANMITARGGGWHFPIDGYGYVGGGGAGPNTANERYNISLNSFASRTAAPAGRDRTRSHTLNGFGYVYSHSGGGTNNQLKYNATLDSWSIPSSTYTTANAYALGYALMGYGYVIGGENGGAPFTQNAQYSDVLDAFTNRANVHSVSQSGGVSFEGLGYVTGGYNGSDISTVSSYNPGTNAWTAKTSLATAQRAQGNDFEDNGIYAVSGTASNTSNFKFNPYYNVWSASLSALNAGREYPMLSKPGFYRNYEVRVAIPAAYAGLGNGIWISVANCPNTRSNGDGFGLQGKGYAVGGFVNGSGTGQANIDLYNPVTDSWMATVPMNTSTYNHGCFVLNGAAYKFNGVNGPSTFVSTNEKFHPDTLVWTNKAAAMTGNSTQGISLNGRGYASQFSAAFGVQYYNDTLDTWTSITNTPIGSTARFSLNGYWYVAGGSGAGDSTNATYRYNDQVNTYTAMGNLTANGWGNGAVVLDGFGYYSRGTSGFSNVIEKYNDAANLWVVAPSLVVGNNGSHRFAMHNSAYNNGGFNGSNLATNQRLTNSISKAVLSAGLTVS